VVVGGGVGVGWGIVFGGGSPPRSKALSLRAKKKMEGFRFSKSGEAGKIHGGGGAGSREGGGPREREGARIHFDVEEEKRGWALGRKKKKVGNEV